MVAKSKPMMDLVSKTVSQSPIALGSSASNSPGALNSDRTDMGKPVAKVSNENTASSSQVWHSDANTITSMEKTVAETTKKTIGANISHHNFEISGNNVGHLEKVYSTATANESALRG